jgi:hypothetical protein
MIDKFVMAYSSDNWSSSLFILFLIAPFGFILLYFLRTFYICFRCVFRCVFRCMSYTF